MDRTIQPTIKVPEFNNVIPLERITLDGGSELFVINAGDQDVLRIDFLFKAGTWNHSKRLIPIFTSDLFKEGSQKYSSFQIAEKLDYYGAFLNQNSTHHYTQVTLFTLSRYLDETLEIVKDLITNPLFSQEEFETLKAKKRQQLMTEKQRVQYLADKSFQNLIFGNQHPYGNIPQLEHFDQISISEVKEFYANNFSSANLKIFISGKLEDNTCNIVKSKFDYKWGKIDTNATPEWSINVKKTARKNILKTDAVQSAIRIGKPIFNKKHPEFVKLQVVNMIFGGFFGSRLMQNIREEKGYTYGISSMLASLPESGIWMVATSCANEYVEDTIKQVFYEMDRMSSELVPEEELFMIKNYFLGELTRSQDGPFALAEACRTLWMYDLPHDYYHQVAKTVQQITAEEIRDLSNKYLNKDDFTTVVCGG